MDKMQEIVEQKKFDLINSEWFRALVEDCKTTIIERRYRIATELLEMKWHIGDRILQDVVKFEKLGISGRHVCHIVSQALDCSTREIYRCIQFRKKYPKLNELPEGKNITWHKIVNQYLPEKTKADDPVTPEDPDIPCPHRQVEILLRCARCRERLGFRKVGREATVDVGKIIDSEKEKK